MLQEVRARCRGRGLEHDCEAVALNIPVHRGVHAALKGVDADKHRNVFRASSRLGGQHWLPVGLVEVADSVSFERYVLR